MLSLDIDALTRARNASEATKTIGIRALPMPLLGHVHAGADLTFQ